MPEEKLPLILHPGSDLALARPQGGRVVAEMVSEALALSRAGQTSAKMVQRFRIGAHVFCEPDYQQILLWAKALEIEPLMVIERLLTERDTDWKKEDKTQFANGQIIRLAWDIILLPLEVFEWVRGLVIESIVFFVPDEHLPVKRSLSLPLPELRYLSCMKLGLTNLDISAVSQFTVLICNDNLLTELKLSTVPQLIWLSCSENQFDKLDLSSVPQLSRLACDNTQLTDLDLSTVPLLTDLMCNFNQLTELDLSAVPQLTELYCYDNMLTELDLAAVPQLTQLLCGINHLSKLKLSAVPQLTRLYCDDNQLTELDIRMLEHLVDLYYDKNKTRLIQRPDQHF
jgi:hypothetical protein